MIWSSRLAEVHDYNQRAIISQQICVVYAFLPVLAQSALAVGLRVS